LRPVLCPTIQIIGFFYDDRQKPSRTSGFACPSKRHRTKKKGRQCRERPQVTEETTPHPC
jgi:hypothetical protein